MTLNRGTICSKRQSIQQNWVMLHYCPIMKQQYAFERKSILWEGWVWEDELWMKSSQPSSSQLASSGTWQCSITADNKQFLSENLVSITKFSTSLCNELKESALFIINGKRFGKLEMEGWNFICHEGKQRCYQLQGCEIGLEARVWLSCFQTVWNSCHMIFIVRSRETIPSSKRSSRTKWPIAW